MVAMDGKSIVERIKENAGRSGHKFTTGKVGVVSSFSKEMRVDDANRDVVAVATTDDLDVQEEIVLPGGADRGYFDKNKKVFVDHSYDAMSTVGLLRNLKRWKGGAADGWLARIHIIESPTNPLVDHILALARVGIGTSIGFEALDYGRPTADEQKKYPGAKSIVRTWHWIELSFTCFPANVACQSLEMTSDDSKAATCREFLTKSRAPLEVFRVLNLELPVLSLPAPVMEIG